MRPRYCPYRALSTSVIPKPRALSPDKAGLSFCAGGETLSKEKDRAAAVLEGLSPREREVLILVVEGRTSKEIARLVGVKPATVDTYRSRIMAKLGVEDLPSLVRFAVRHGLIKP